jgi:hypothetical protein
MPDVGAVATLVLTRGGRQALDIIKAGGRGSVAAVFERSFYIAFDRGWVCMGAEALPLGPLNVRSSAPGSVIWDSGGLSIDDQVLSIAGAIRVGRTLEFSTASVVTWDPPVPPPWTSFTAKAGLDALDCLVKPRTDAGLACFVMSDRRNIPYNAITVAAKPSIDVLSRAVEHAFMGGAVTSADLDHPVMALLGLGPGLTPSGDDFLGGMLIALATIPAPVFRARLLDLIERHAQQRTNAISIAHLRAAAAGAGHAALHDTLNSLLAGDAAALPARLAAIDKIGHSSGWDSLAGMCITLRAHLAVQKVGV